MGLLRKIKMKRNAQTLMRILHNEEEFYLKIPNVSLLNI